MEYLAIFSAVFIYTASKAFQQLNVVHEQIFQIIPTSYFMAYLEIAKWGLAAKAVLEQGWMGFVFAGFFMGTGAWMGSICAIKAHAWLRK